MSNSLRTGRWALVCLAMWLDGGCALAAIGDFDPRFGNGGTVDYPAGFEGLVGLPDGRLQLASLSQNSLRVLRFDSNGRPDAGFGTGGVVETVVAAGSIRVRGAYANDNGSSYLRLLADGNLVLTPQLDNVFQHEARLMRLASDGRPDPAFGPDGMRAFPFTGIAGANISEIADIAVAPGGAVYVLVRYLYDYYECGFAPRIFRLLPTGELDTNFGNGGEYRTSRDEACVFEEPHMIALSGDRLLLFSADSTTTILNPQGRADIPPTAWQDSLVSSALSDGALAGQYVVAVGASISNGLRVDFARWRQDLSLDNTFGSSGSGHTVVTVGALPFVPSYIDRVRLLAPGAADPYLYATIGLLSAPTTGISSGRQFAEILIRLHAGGEIDQSFGSNGVVIAGSVTYLDPADQQPDGSLIVTTARRSAIRLADVEGASPGMIDMGLDCSMGTAYLEPQHRISIPVSRTLGSSGAVTVAFRTKSVTATPGSDYVEASGTLNWAAGEQGVKQIELELIDDAFAEQNEAFDVVLQSMAGNALITCAQGHVIIAQNAATAAAVPPVSLPSPPAGAVPAGGGGSIDYWLLGLLLGSLLLTQRRASVLAASAPRGRGYPATVSTSPSRCSHR